MNRKKEWIKRKRNREQNHGKPRFGGEGRGGRERNAEGNDDREV